MNIVQFMDKFLIGYQLSAVETASQNWEKNYISAQLSF